MTIPNLVQTPTLAQLKSAFAKFRSTVHNNQIVYPEELRIMAVSFLNNFSFNTVMTTCEISPSALLKWKNRLQKQIQQAPRHLSIVKDEEIPSGSFTSISSGEVFLKCPSGLEIKIPQSFVPELLRLCGGLK